MTDNVIPDSQSEIPDDSRYQRVQDFIAPYTSRFQENITRAIALVQLYVTLSESKDYAQHSAIDDILRSSVVLAHATLEDLLRTIGLNLLPSAESNALNNIPLEGLSLSGRPEKFFLGDLTKFKGKTVDDVIYSSIANYLNRHSFNNVTDISILLRYLGINISKVNRTFPQLAQLMERRHIIVHQADRIVDEVTGEVIVTSVDPAEVMVWFQALIEFFQDLITEVATLGLLGTSNSTDMEPNDHNSAA